MIRPIQLLSFSELENKKPTHARIKTLDLVLIKYGDKVSVLYGRCLHRGALMADGTIKGDSIICGVHNTSWPNCNGCWIP
jgi:nitrite reductase/ring-hydroxylating ferredoxin subunit